MVMPEKKGRTCNKEKSFANISFSYSIKTEKPCKTLKTKNKEGSISE